MFFSTCCRCRILMSNQHIYFFLSNVVLFYVQNQIHCSQMWLFFFQLLIAFYLQQFLVMTVQSQPRQRKENKYPPLPHMAYFCWLQEICSSWPNLGHEPAITLQHVSQQYFNLIRNVFPSKTSRILVSLIQRNRNSLIYVYSTLKAHILQGQIRNVSGNVLQGKGDKGILIIT